MDAWPIIRDVTAVLAIALALGVLFERIGQSALIAYLLAGLIAGPTVLDLINDATVIRGLAELGVAFLIFSIGLEMSGERLRHFSASIVALGVLQITLTAAVVAGVTRLFGTTWTTAIGMGLILAPSSTACVVRLLDQRSELDSIHGRNAFGILIVQDFALVPLLMGVRMLGIGGSEGGTAIIALLSRLTWAAAFVAVFFLIARFALPRLVNQAALSRNRELPLLLAITICLASAGGAQLLDLSPVLGAFIAGVLLAGTPYATWIRADVGALRTVFLTLFFTSIAMIEDLSWVTAHWQWLLAAVPVVLFGKTVVVWLGARLMRVRSPHALAAGLCISQTGEFSFVLADVGHETGTITEPLFQLVVATTVLTLLLTPSLVQAAAVIARRPSRGHRAVGEAPSAASRNIVIVGMGPAGHAVYQSVAELCDTTIIDLNPRGADGLEPPPGRFIAGDASQATVLRSAGIGKAAAVVITIPDHEATLRIAKLARQMRPDVPILARARYQRFAAMLREGTSDIVDEELLTGEALAERLRTALWRG